MINQIIDWSIIVELYISITIFMCIFFILIAIIYIRKANKYKKKLLSLQDADLDKDIFNKTFNIKCNNCNNIFNTSYNTCPNCGAPYHNNKEYLENIKNNNTEYFNYLQNIKKEIEEILNIYYKVVKDLKTNIIVSHSLFDFNIKEPQREKIEEVSIFCEYCGTKIELKVDETIDCPNCGSSCKDNMELQTYIKKNEIIELEQKKYQDLNELLVNQNIKNKKFDEFISNKHLYSKIFSIILLIILPIILSFLIEHYIPHNIIKSLFDILSNIVQISMYILTIFVLYYFFIKKQKK